MYIVKQHCPYTMATARKICRYPPGKCPRGDTCMFHHDPEAKHQGTRAPLPNWSLYSKQSSITLATKSPFEGATRSAGPSLCKYHATGSCIYGNSCRYLHAPPERLEQPQPLACKFFRSIGGCKLGEKCPYGHGEIPLGRGMVLNVNAASVIPTAVRF